MTQETDCCTPEPAIGQGSGMLTPRQHLWSWVRSPPGLTVVGLGVVAMGFASNWSWLVAVGAAPLVLSLAPCAAMCALGLCMNMKGHSGTTAVKPDTHAGAGLPPSTPSSPVRSQGSQ